VELRFPCVHLFVHVLTSFYFLYIYMIVVHAFISMPWSLWISMPLHASSTGVPYLQAGLCVTFLWTAPSSLSFSQNVKGPVRVPEYNTGSHSTSQRASQDYTLKTYNMCAQALKARRDKLRREKLIKVSSDAS
jgi:hypothetical protein